MSSIILLERYFSRLEFFLARYFLARIFPLEISLQDIFFWSHPYPPKKSNVRPLSLYVLFFQCTQGHVIIALENCFIQISRCSCACITHNLWKDKEANFPETFIGRTKHQGPKLTLVIFIYFYIKTTLWKDKEANLPETFIGKTKQ